MKHACPSCQGPGISGIHKRWSARECPATCSLCGGLAHVLASTSSGIFVGTLLCFLVAVIGVIAVTAAPLPAVLVAAGVTVVFNCWAWRRAEMFPIPKENAATARAAGWFMLGVWAFLALLN